MSIRVRRRRPQAPLLFLQALLLLLLPGASSSSPYNYRRGGGGGGARSPPPLAFFANAKNKNQKSSSGWHPTPNNGTTSFLTTGHSTLHMSNCTVTLLSLDSGGGLRGAANGNMTSSSPSTTNAAGRALAGTRAVAAVGQGGGNAVDLLVGEALQVIGGALFEAMCFYVAGKIIMGVRGLWSRTSAKPTGVRFADVIGCDHAKEEVMELVQYLRQPLKYKKMGAKIPKGVLLVGPPGVGKTMLARAIAGETNCPFYYASGSDFAAPFWGQGIQRVKKLFRQARKAKRSIIFIDEFDALARARRNSLSGGSAEMDAENTLNQLLTEMDGFQSSDNVIVIASTNRPDVLDRAALRPGRFDRKVFLDAPDVQGREQHFKHLLSKFKLEKSVDEVAPMLARLSPGYSGADIENVCNEAALRAAKLNRTCVTEEDLSWATERTGFGVERKGKILPEELRRTAVHEAGHALVAYMLPSAEPPVKISIINRGKMGGYNLMGETNHTYHTESRLRDDVCVFLGGRVAEELVLGEASSGAFDDLKKASAISRGMVESLGYGKKAGLLSYGGGGGPSSPPVEVSQTALRLLEEEAQSILTTEYARAKGIVGKHRKALLSLVDLLLEKEVVHEHDIAACFGPRIAAPRPSLTAGVAAASSSSWWHAWGNKNENEEGEEA